MYCNSSSPECELPRSEILAPLYSLTRLGVCLEVDWRLPTARIFAIAALRLGAWAARRSDTSKPQYKHRVILSSSESDGRFKNFAFAKNAQSRCHVTQLCFLVISRRCSSVWLVPCAHHVMPKLPACFSAQHTRCNGTILGRNAL
jgi:hypothetical protein